MNSTSAPIIRVCFSPLSFPLFEEPGQVVVVVDVLRATSAICSAFAHGVERMVPIATLEEAEALKEKGMVVAAERNGEVMPGFPLGNSPLAYTSGAYSGQTIAITTTNGTRAIEAAKNAHSVVIGAFVNLDGVVQELLHLNRSVVVLCAGWKDRFNFEDTLFAGAVVEKLLEGKRFVTDCDSARAAHLLFHQARHDLFGFLQESSHRERLGRLHLEDDIRYCLTPNQTAVVPKLVEGKYLSL